MNESTQSSPLRALLAGARVPTPLRATLALLVGAIAAWHAWVVMQAYPDWLALDFSFPWRAARALLAHQDPYAVIRATGAYPYNANFVHPLPAALLSLPFAPLSAHLAGAAFGFMSFALLTWALTRASIGPMLLLASAPALWSLQTLQLTPLLVAAALLPALGGLLAAKPTIGLALWLRRPTMWATIGGVALVAIAFVVMPDWVARWLDAIRTNPFDGFYRAPITSRFGGPLLAAALLRWRREEGRLLLAMACVPQTFIWYDQLPVLLCARGARQRTAVVAASLIGCGISLLRIAPNATPREESVHHEPFVLAFVYLPALVCVLLSANEGAVPAWLERVTATLPRWLRGARAGRPS